MGRFFIGLWSLECLARGGGVGQSDVLPVPEGEVLPGSLLSGSGSTFK